MSGGGTSLLGGRAGRAYERAQQVGYRSLPLHVVSVTLTMVGAGVLLSALVELIDGGDKVVPLAASGLLWLAVGVGGFQATRMPDRVQILDIFVTVVAAWLGLILAGALPYILAGTFETLDDAIFESVSGFTTTGATVLRPIEGTSKGILFWRSMSQWIGGMGVIVLVVAVLPTIGGGGMDLLVAEAPGPTGERLTPRVQETAKRLWIVYVAFTIIVIIAYMIFGMNLYDAVSHSFTTVSTGGFSPYNGSLGHFESAAIEWVAITAMFIAGGSFVLWYKVLRGNPKPLLYSAEFQAYLGLVLIATIIVYLTSGQSEIAVAEGIRNSIFAVLTVVSTTGYGTENFGDWDVPAQGLLLLLMPLGGMAGSTAGGVKMVRLLAVASYAHRETLRQLHPRLVRPIRIGTATVTQDVTNRIMGFLILALAVFGTTAMLLLITGADLVTGLSGAASSLGNVGPGLGDIAPDSDFRNIPRPGRLISLVAMLLGRLEIYPVLLALSAIPILPRRLRR